MIQTGQDVKERKAKVTGTLLQDLHRSRNQLQHLIYSMEHDRSLNAEATRLIALKQLLSGIEEQLAVTRLGR